MGNVPKHNGVHAEPVWNPNDTPAPTIREQTENTPHMLHGSSNNSDGYMNDYLNLDQFLRKETQLVIIISVIAQQLMELLDLEHMTLIIMLEQTQIVKQFQK